MLVWFAAALLWLASAVHAQAQPQQLDNIKDVYAKLHSCWRPPPASRANPIDITVIVSFNRDGAILGHPRITYESANAGDNDRLRTGLPSWRHCNAVRRCHLPRVWAVPLPAGLSRSRFRTRKRPPKPEEKRAWLIPKIL